MLHKALPVAAAVVEFAGGPTAWVTRTYSASQGAGAQCNGKELKVTNTTDVTQSLLVKPTATALSVKNERLMVRLSQERIAAGYQNWNNGECEKQSCEAYANMEVHHVRR